MVDSTPCLWQQLDLQGHGSSGDGGTGAGESEASGAGAASNQGRASAPCLMERVCAPSNLNEAYFRVVRNKGAAGVDGMHVDQLRSWIAENKEALISSLLDGTYRPQPVRGVQIPKPGGKGMRQLGIPTAVDRLVQQAMLQVLQPRLDREFSDGSFGFRPGRSAHDAMRRASEHVREGFDVVVDLDLEKFFDRVNHDMLMARLARHVEDKRVLKVVRAFLNAGMMANGVVVSREQGTPQGGPLSPLLANLMLDDLDKELEWRGHRFVRYADDCNIYVQSSRAGERVLASVSQFLEKRLKLQVNREKSAAAPVHERQFLGYRLFRDGSLGLAPESQERLKRRLRELLRRNQPGNLLEKIERLNRMIRGWVGYFRLARCASILRQLDSWIQRKLRCLKLKQLKWAKGIGRFLMARGLNADAAWTLAGSSKGWWRMSCTPQANRAMDRTWFRRHRLISMAEEHARYQAERNRLRAEQACQVV